jgi:hypothetical protein
MDSGLCIHKVWNRLARGLYYLWQVDDIQWSGAGRVVDYRTSDGILLLWNVTEIYVMGYPRLV